MEKEYNIRYICLVKNITRKIQWNKTMLKGKRVQDIFISPLNQTTVYERMKTNLSCQLLKSFTWSYFVKGIQDYHINKFIECLDHHSS
jgi:septum formation inhibitor-activating ATPase MinD